MNSKRTIATLPLLLWLSLAVIVLISSGCAHYDSGKKVIGETAQISMTDGNIEYLARIDTGARITSVHALDVEVAGGSQDKEDSQCTGRGIPLRGGPESQLAGYGQERPCEPAGSLGDVV